MATLCSWTIVHGWHSERTQFLRIFELRAEILAFKRLLKLLVPASLAPALLDRAYRDARLGGGGGGGAGAGTGPGGGDGGGGGGGGRGKKGGAASGAWTSGAWSEAGASEKGQAAPSGAASGAIPGFVGSGVGNGDARFAERFDEASVLFAEGEAPGCF